MLVDHAFTIPLALLWPGAAHRPSKIIPVEINTVQHPLPQPARCSQVRPGRSAAPSSYTSGLHVLVVGTGGLSHQLDGKRAGLHQQGIRRLNCASTRSYRAGGAGPPLHPRIWVEQCRHPGRRTSELDGHARRVLRGGVSELSIGNYHIPISNTAAATVVYDNAVEARRKAA